MIISIFIYIKNSPTLDLENDDIGDSQEPLSDNQQMTSDIRGASSRGIWVDTFDIESRVESKNNVELIDGDVILTPKQQLMITTTQEFDNGTKNNIETNTDCSNIPQGELQLFKSNWFTDDFEGVNGQAVSVYDPNWVTTITDGSSITIDTSEKKNGLASVKWDYDNTWPGESKIVQDLKNYANDDLILFYRMNLINYAPDAFFVQTADENGNKYANFVFGYGEFDPQNFHYYNGTTFIDSGYQYSQDVWYKLKIVHDIVNKTWDAWIDGGVYNNFKIVEKANNLDSTTSGNVTKLTLRRGNGWQLHHAEYWIDNITIGESPQYATNGSWQSSEIDLPSFFRLKDTTITFSELEPNKAEIDNIEWLVNDDVKASYETDIEDSSFTPFTIKDSDLTFGSFKDVDSDFTIKVHLMGDGTRTPVVEQIEVDLVPIVGNITSLPIILYQNEYWDKLVMNKTTTETSLINLTILDAATNQAIPLYEDLSEANIDLTDIRPHDYLSIKLHAEFISDGEFFPKLHDWSVTWQPDYPRLIQNIPNNNSFDEDTTAGHLIDLGLYFEDKYDPIEDLIFTIQYESNPSHIHTYLDGYYLNFTTSTINWSGVESFIIECEDTSGLAVHSNEFDVTVDPIDDAPVWNVTTTELYMDEDEKKLDWLNFNYLVYDAEGDQLDFKIISQTNENNIDVTIDTQNKLDIEPVENYVGNNTFTIQVYEVLNTQMYSNITFKVHINPINDPPELNLIGTQTAIEDQWLNFTLTATDPDDGDLLTYNCDVTDRSNFNINSSTGEISFFPLNKNVGILNVNFSVHDSKNVYDFENIIINISNTNDPPSSITILAPENNSEFKTNQRIDFLAGDATDIDVGDELTYYWDFDVSDGIHQDATGTRVNHSYPINGTYTVTLTISDGKVGVDAAININVKLPPEAEKAEKIDQDWLAENWWIFVIILIIAIILTFTLIVMRRRKKDRGLADYIDSVDSTFNASKSDADRCENELESKRKTFLEDFKNHKISKEDFAILDRKIDEYIKKLHPSIPLSNLKVAQPIALPQQPTVQQPQPQRVAKCHKCDEIIKVYTTDSLAVVKCPKCGEEGTI